MRSDASFALTLTQQDIYFDHLHAPHNPRYNVGGYIRLRGVDAERLCRAHAHLVRSEDVFGVRIDFAGELPQQRLDAARTESLARVDLRGESDPVGAADAWIATQFRAPFVIDDSELFRAVLLQLGEAEYRYVGVAHHVLLDGWGFANWARRLGALYQADAAPTDASIDWRSAALDDAAYPASARYASDRDYWRAALPVHVGEVLPAFHRARHADPSCIASVRHTLVVDAARYTRLATAATASGSGIVQVLLALLTAYCVRTSTGDAIVLGVPSHGRRTAADKQAIGVFTNVSPLAIDPSGCTTLAALAQRIGERQKASYRHQRYPLGQILRDRGTSGPDARLYDVAFSYLKLDSGLVIDGEPASLHYVSHGHEKTPLLLTVWEYGAQRPVELQFDANLAHFSDEEARLLVARFDALLQQFEADPSIALDALDPVAPREQGLLAQFARTQDLPARTLALHQGVEQQADRHGTAIAVVQGDTQLSYAQLDAQANQIAHYLIAHGVKRGDVVGICVERSARMVVGLLGILKAGAAYAPLDPAYPALRLSQMREDSDAAVILSEPGAMQSLPAGEAAVVMLDAATFAAYPTTRPNLAVAMDDLAYLIFTSGSTGRPKAVEIRHRNVAARLAWAEQAYATAVLSRVLASTSLNFDLSVFELFVPLSFGHTVVVVKDALALLDQPVDVTLINTVPSAIKVLLDNAAVPASVREVNLAGEPLPGETVNRLLAETTCTVVHNLYGPSEDTTYSTGASFRAPVDRPPGIGKPLPNTRAYVLSAQGQPVPVGVVGELYLGGAGVTRGYRHREELTQERYLADPFVSGTNPPLQGEGMGGDGFLPQPHHEAIMYRTGDQVRWRADGELDYLGRADDQVKVRGFRIELGEIEWQLRRQDGVREAVVVARGTPGEQRVVAYLVGDQRDDDALRQNLRGVLPDYMVPAAFVHLDALPLTPNGKVDKRALPEPDWQDSAELVAADTPTEALLAQIWAQILNRDAVSVTANFFALGGHSLLATRVASAIQAQWHRKVGVRAIFEYPSVRALAGHIDTLAADAAPAIRAVPRDGLLPLSYAQQRLWFIDQFDGESHQYNMPGALRLRGMLDAPALQAALDGIVARHEILRTTYAQHEGSAIQRIAAPSRVPLRQIDLRALPSAEQGAEVERLRRAEALAPFDLRADLMLRVTHLQLSDDESVLLFTLHHIAADGWSLGVLVRELMTLYAAHQDRVEAKLPPLAIQYADYANWQRETLQGELLNQQLGYWRDQLAGIPAVHNLPLDRPRPAQQRFDGALHLQQIDADLLKQLRALAQAQGATLFMLLQAAFALLIGRWSGEDDVVVGTPIAGRTHPAVEPLIGFFINTLVLRTQLPDQASFVELLAQTRQTALQAYAHQDVPFEMLVDALQPARSLSHTPVFQILFTLQNTPQVEFVLDGVRVGEADLEQAGSKFDLELTALEDDQGLRLSWQYEQSLFNAATIRRLGASYACLLRSIVATPQAAIGALALTPATDVAEQQAWNRPALAPSPHTTIAAWFEAQVRREPAATAVVDADGRHCSYRELDRRARQLALELRRHGARAGVLVALSAQRGIDLIAGLLGILQTGAAYLPLDPDYPPARRRHMLADARVQLLLTDDAARDDALPGLHVVVLDSVAADAPELALDDVRGEWDDAQLAYVVYTSGSTGVPKGVMVGQSALVHHLQTIQHQYVYTRNDRVLQFANSGFDTAAEQIFATLLAGAALHLRSRELQDAKAFARWLVDRRISAIDLPPSYAADVLPPLFADDAFWRSAVLRQIVIGGEAFPQSVADAWRRHERQSICRLLNAYGPTEATITSHVQVLAAPGDGAHARVPIGRTLPGTRSYVVDAANALLPIGVIGELLIGGPRLAQGYLGREDLNADRFIADPFASEPDARVYRTGDLVRYRLDGSLEFAGRVDEQIKLRGFRIELGEIESELTRHPAVTQAAVCAFGEGSARRLVAFVVTDAAARESGESLHDVLRAHLRATLPDYMVPTVIVDIAALPLNANGKVDKRQLPDPGIPRTAQHVEPTTATERALASVWAELLQLERVSVTANFFELGGHSLLATRLVSAIAERFDKAIGVRVVFEHPTVRELSAHLDALGVAVIDRIPVVSTDAVRPLSFAQQRLWLIDQIEGGSSQYNISAGFRLSGDLDTAALQTALDAVVARHEVLRTTYAGEGDEAEQVIHAQGTLSLQWRDLSALAADAQESAVRAAVDAEAVRVFDLRHEVPLRVIVLRLSASEQVVVFTLHHIAADGWSLGVLVREFVQAYVAASAGESPAWTPLAIQYADYAHWQRSAAQQTVLDQQLHYWRDQLAGLPRVHSLPLDFARPPQASYAAESVEVEVDATLLQSVKALAQSQEATLFMVLQATYALLLSRWSGEDDVVMGVPIAGRTRPEVEPLIGFFINTLVFRSTVSSATTVSQWIAQARQTALQAYAHQELPFELLIDALQPERDLAYNPLCQVKFILQNYESQELELPGLRLTPLAAQSQQIRFDLDLTVTEREGMLGLNFSYKTALFADATIRRFAEAYVQLLRGMVAAPNAALAELPLLAPDSAQQMRALGKGEVVVEGREACLAEAIRAASVLHADAVAVRDASCRALTHAQLEAQSNRLAQYLIEQGVAAGQFVGIVVERSVELIVSLLAIQKTGAAYVPLDARQGKARVAEILSDAQISWVLASSARGGELPVAGIDLVFTDGIADAGDWLADYPAQAPDVTLNADDAVYAIYTSGSTGKPKGVLIKQSGLMDYCAFAQQHYYAEGLDGSLVVTSAAFDLTVPSLYVPLLVGGCVELLADEGELEGLALALAEAAKSPPLQGEGVGGDGFGLSADHCDGGLKPALRGRNYLLRMTPGHVQGLLALLSNDANVANSHHVFVIGGEAFTPTLAVQLQQRFANSTIYNHYGPTETVVGCALHRVDVERDAALLRLPIGRAMHNTRLYVLDAARQPVPVGVAGELHIGGAGVAIGYLHRAELTAEKFIADPFVDGERVYRTGDLVRWRADGELEFLGRADDQVKLRGFRIELGEIESRLRQLDGVREAVVRVRGEEDAQQLVAYVVAAAETHPHPHPPLEGEGFRAEASAVETLPFKGRAWVGMGFASAESWSDTLRLKLQSQLPDYMIPTAWVVLDELPRTPNGKLDNRALPEPGKASADTYIEPATPTEQAVAELWAALLKRETVSATANFFALGGNSLLATRVVSAVAERLHKRVAVRSVFEHASVRAFAQHIDEQATTIHQPIPVVARDADLPLSFAQQRLWFIDELEGGTPQYNMPVAVRLHGKLDELALQTALDTLVARHEVLRTTYITQGEHAVQRIAPIEAVAIRRSTIDEASLDAFIAHEARQPFALGHEAPLRVSLLTLGSTDHVVLFTLHHIASDGWSMGLVIDEFVTSYEAAVGKTTPRLPALPVQYADYAQWQRTRLQGEALEQTLSYWRTHLASLPAVHSLPLDHARPAQQQFSGARLARQVDVSTKRQVEQLAQQENATPFMLLQAVFALLLGRWSGEDDIVIGTPVAGRTHRDVERLVGFFVNTLVLRTDLSGDPTFRALLAQSRTNALAAQAHQELPFEMLVDALQPTRSLSHTPVFQIMFSLRNHVQGRRELSLSGLQLDLLQSTTDSVKFDLELVVTETEAGLDLEWLYADSLFERTTVERMADAFERLLGRVLVEADTPVAQLPLLDAHAATQMRALGQGEVVSLGREVCLVDAIRNASAQHADATAVRDASGRSLTHAELDAQSNRLARYLIAQGVAAGQFVGIVVERSVELIVGLLAIQKTGAAYVPLDPRNGATRLAEILDDAAIAHVLAPVTPLVEGWASVASVTVQPWLANEAAAYAATAPNIVLNADDAVYAIYTSGSTGKPKGVLIRQSGLMDYCAFAQQRYYAQALDGSLVVTSAAFDLTVPSLYVPLLVGGCVELLADEGELEGLAVALAAASKNPPLQGEGMGGDGFSLSADQRDGGLKPALRGRNYLLRMTPGHVQGLLALLPNDARVDQSRHVFVIGGEAFTPTLAAQLQQRFANSTIYNHYGPTETVVGCALHRVDVERDAALLRLPIGRAMHNTRLYVLDAARQPVPVGVAGELHIGGAGVAIGYLHRAELTAEKFIADPFVEGERVYRTGDLVRWRADGELEFLGRADDQVKLRGFRIELGEIESRLRLLDGVSEAVVRVRGEEDAQQLVAYVVAAAETHPHPNPPLEGEGVAASADQSLPFKGVKVRRSEPQVLTDLNAQRAGRAWVGMGFASAESWSDTLRLKLQSQLPDYMIPTAWVVLDELPRTPNGKMDNRALPEPTLVEREHVEAATATEAALVEIWQQLLRRERVSVTTSFFELGGHSLLATRAVNAMRQRFEVDIPLRVLFERAAIRGLAEYIDMALIRRANAMPATQAETVELEW